MIPNEFPVGFYSLSVSPAPSCGVSPLLNVPPLAPQVVAILSLLVLFDRPCHVFSVYYCITELTRAQAENCAMERFRPPVHRSKRERERVWEGAAEEK